MSPTAKQELGTRGEQLVAKHVQCPGCKRQERTLRALPPNFKCADVVCDFCGYLAQVKTKSVSGKLPDACPRLITGAAWGPQLARMDAGIYFSLYIVIESANGDAAIYFLPRDLQTREMYTERTPLAATAKRAGWVGFMIDTSKAMAPPTRYTVGSTDTFRLTGPSAPKKR